jgi:hypothetical protein
LDWYDITFYNADGEHDGYWAQLTPQQAVDVEAWLKLVAFHGDWSDIAVTKINTSETPDYSALMAVLEERLGIEK